MRCARIDRFWLPVLAAGLCACANPGAGLTGTDSDASFAGLRATWEIPRPTISDGRPPARQLLLQAELSRSDAQFDSDLSAGETVTVDGTQFVGPLTLATDFDLYLASVDARLRLRSEHAFGMDVFGGLGFTRMELDASAASGTAALEQDGFGPRVGLGLFCELPPRLRFFLDGFWQPTFVGSGDVADVQALDLGLELRLSTSIELVLAWRGLDYGFEDSGADSDLDLGAQGPRLSIALRL